MFITIEDAPDLIVCSPSPTTLLTRFEFFCIDCVLDQLQRCAVKRINGHQHPIPV
jgi:hypothetical protein